MSSSAEEIDNEVCTYSNQPKTEATTAKTVKMSFNKKCENMMVTACQLGTASPKLMPKLPKRKMPPKAKAATPGKTPRCSRCSSGRAEGGHKTEGEAGQPGWYYYEGMCLGKDSSPPDIPPHSTLVFEVDCKSVK